MIKKTWQERVKELEKYNEVHQLSIRGLATVTGLSLGKLCQDLNLAAALRVYPDLEKEEKYVNAVYFMKKKKFKRES